MSKHTPGPWRINGTRIVSETARLEFCPELPVCVVDCRSAMSGDDTQADKRLIAAAPVLLDACKLAHARLTAMFLASGHYALAPTLQALGDAIEQATKE